MTAVIWQKLQRDIEEVERDHLFFFRLFYGNTLLFYLISSRKIFSLPSVKLFGFLHRKLRLIYNHVGHSKKKSTYLFLKYVSPQRTTEFTESWGWFRFSKNTAAPPKPIMVLEKQFLQNLANYKSTSTFCVERVCIQPKSFTLGKVTFKKTLSEVNSPYKIN